MLSKLKNLFSQQTLPTQPSSHSSLPHPEISEADAAQCPFMQNKSSAKETGAQKCPATGKTVPKAEVDSDSEEEKPRGGCPFMSGTSNKKKNPDLNLKEAGFDEPFVSRFKFYLSETKLDFTSLKSGLPQAASTREVFRTYPSYLQHTLFFNGEDYKKIRALECCSRFMAYETLREKGNKKFNKGKYYEALDFYERAMSLFRWLEYHEMANESTISTENHLEESLEEVSENGSKVNIALAEDKPSQEDPSAAFEELKTKYKEFFVTYCDENTKLFEGEEMTEDADIDMRKSLLIQVYLNMCAAYIHTHHYRLAEQVCDDGIALSEKVSQLYFRKAQALSLASNASLQQLQRAKQCIDIAIERRAGEKIFATANQNILKMLNIHDSAEAYEACRQHIEDSLAQRTSTNATNYARVYQRVKEIHENERRILAEGRVPQESREERVLENTTEMKTLNRMASKYVKVVEFYTEAKNPEQVLLAKQEFQEILRIKSEVQELLGVELRENEEELGGLASDKVQGRLAYVKTYFAEQIYNSGKFNFTMLEWAIKEIVKEEEEERKKKVQAEKRAESERRTAEGLGEVQKGRGNLVYLLVLLPLLAILLGMFVL